VQGADQSQCLSPRLFLRVICDRTASEFATIVLDRDGDLELSGIHVGSSEGSGTLSTAKIDVRTISSQHRKSAQLPGAMTPPVLHTARK